MLKSCDVISFIAARDFARSKKFSSGVLGLKLLSEDGFAQVYDIHGRMLRVTKVNDVVLAPYTVLGWRVKNTPATVKRLHKAGVKFEIYKGLGQDEFGVWTAPGGTRVAWYKDPDGNLLSVSDQ
jgi:catechol 2,3-dioxygenase-like lactoylglutathione lyase family enzyme